MVLCCYYCHIVNSKFPHVVHCLSHQLRQSLTIFQSLKMSNLLLPRDSIYSERMKELNATLYISLCFYDNSKKKSLNVGQSSKAPNTRGVFWILVNSHARKPSVKQTVIFTQKEKRHNKHTWTQQTLELWKKSSYDTCPSNVAIFGIKLLPLVKVSEHQIYDNGSDIQLRYIFLFKVTGKLLFK